jgi:hypothetical protein
MKLQFNNYILDFTSMTMIDVYNSNITWQLKWDNDNNKILYKGKNRNMGREGDWYASDSWHRDEISTAYATYLLEQALTAQPVDITGEQRESGDKIGDTISPET